MNELATVSRQEVGFLANAGNTFEGVQQLAELMAKMGTMPVHLRDKPADCFRVVLQAIKWGMDPFAVAECTSLVHGKMCYEGKLVAAVLTSMGAIEGRLTYEIEGSGQDASIVVRGTPRGGIMQEVRGTVRDWKTTGNGSPWDKQPETQLVYRGTRQWARMYAPEAILGVHAQEEVEPPREVEATVRGAMPEIKPAIDRAPLAECDAFQDECPADMVRPNVADATAAFARLWKMEGGKEAGRIVLRSRGIKKVSELADKPEGAIQDFIDQAEESEALLLETQT